MLQSAAQPGFRLLIERCDAHIAQIAIFQTEADNLRANDIARQRQFNWPFRALATNGDLDLRVALAAHLFHGFLQRQALHGSAIQMRDEIPGPDAGARCGGFVNRADNLDIAAFLRDFDAKPTEFAAGLCLHVPEAALIQIG